MNDFDIVLQMHKICWNYCKTSGLI